MPPPVRLAGLALVALLLSVLVLPSGAGQGDQPAQVTVEAREADCPQGHRWCLVVTEGNLSQLTQGQTVEVTLVNAGNSGHQLSMAYWHDRDPSHEDTPSEAAFFTIERVPADGSSTGTTQVPSDAHNLYLWCDVPAHEQGGMWIEAPVVVTEGSGAGDRSASLGAGVAILAGVLATASTVARRG